MFCELEKNAIYTAHMASLQEGFFGRLTQDIGPRKYELTHMNYGTNVCFILQSVSLMGVSTKTRAYNAWVI
jgi:hypothetical protein